MDSEFEKKTHEDSSKSPNKINLGALLNTRYTPSDVLHGLKSGLKIFTLTTLGGLSKNFLHSIFICISDYKSSCSFRNPGKGNS
jgi:hypothetical protein